jgi:hypothetical protein
MKVWIVKIDRAIMKAIALVFELVKKGAMPIMDAPKMPNIKMAKSILGFFPSC